MNISNSNYDSNVDDMEKFLQESLTRMKDISDLIMQHCPDHDGNKTLLEVAEEMDKVKQRVKKEQTALVECKNYLNSAEKPWDVNINEIFQGHLEACTDENPKKKSKKNKNSYYNVLKKHMEEHDGEVMVLDKEGTQQTDPWTRQPIQNPVQSSSCKHMYDKKSINCIIKNRPHFKCPYMGCQNVITKDQLIYLDDD